MTALEMSETETVAALGLREGGRDECGYCAWVRAIACVGAQM